MSKKYLSLDEAASMLGMPREEITRLREKGELRGFADRGTWKFKVEDIETLGRSRQADSDPEVPMMLDDSESGDAIVIGDDSVPDLFAEDLMVPEDSSSDRDLLSNSDSDVRLILDDELADAVSDDLGDSDSDVKLVGDASDSDSDVKLADDATVREITMPDSDSDVKLALPGDGADAISLDRSDSDVQLLPDSGSIGHASDSDVAILGSDSAVSLDFGDSARSESVLPDEFDLGPTSSGILSGGSGVGIRPNDSGIALDDDDEGITLASPSGPGSGISLGDDSGISLSAADSGISLSAADSGISLEAVADSGISLEDSRDFTGTVPMMNVMGEDDDAAPTTKFEMPAMDEDSAFEMATSRGKKGAKAQTDETGVLDISDDDGSLDDAVFDVDDDAADDSSADLDMSDDLVEDDEDVEELDVFDADEVFEGDADDELAGAPVGRRAAASSEPEWGTGMNVAAGFAALTTLACAFIAFDLVRSMWLWGDRPAEPGFFLGLVSKLF